jgi:hypothetical protein
VRSPIVKIKGLIEMDYVERWDAIVVVVVVFVFYRLASLAYGLRCSLRAE